MKVKKRFIVIVLGLLLAGGMLYYFREIVGYILLAWVISMAGRPLMRFFQRHLRIGKYSMGARLAAGLTLTCLLILITLLIALFVPIVVNQASNFADINYKGIVESFNQPIDAINLRLERIGASMISRSQLEQQLNISVTEWFNFTQLGETLSSVLSTIGTLLITVFSVIFITFFFLKDQSLFNNLILAAAPSPYEQRVNNILNDITRLLTRYFAGISLQILSISTFVSISLGILGIEYALLIAVFAALINVIPYLGPILGATFGIFIAVSSNLGLDFYTELLPLILKLIVVFGVVQLIDNLFLQPYIFATSVLAHPLEIFIVILMGAQLNGVFGMILAIPSYTVLRVIARAFLSEFRLIQKITGSIANIDKYDGR